jgi:S1-C subfamily serine protease
MTPGRERPWREVGCLKWAARIPFYTQACLPLWEALAGEAEEETMLVLRRLEKLGVFVGLAIALSGVPVRAQIPDLNAGRVPTLAPLVKEVAPAVVNISVQSRVREDNPPHSAQTAQVAFDSVHPEFKLITERSPYMRSER